MEKRRRSAAVTPLYLMLYPVNRFKALGDRSYRMVDPQTAEIFYAIGNITVERLGDTAGNARLCVGISAKRYGVPYSALIVLRLQKRNDRRGNAV